MSASLLTNAPGNYSLYAIPAAWLLSIAPHFYSIALSKGLTEKGGKPFDVTQPRAWLAEVSNGKSPLHARIVRSEAAQQNGFENLGFFAAAIVAGNIAKLPSSELNMLAGGYLVARAIYNLIYINNTTETTGNMRTATFLASVGMCFTLFIKAGNAMFHTIL